MNKEEKTIPQNGQGAFYVDTFRPEDAEGIVRLFRSVYGEGYPIRLFYDREEIIAANRDGSYISIVARTHSGEVIGVSHLYRSAPYKRLYEVGVGLVMKDYRNSGASKATMSYLFNEFAPRNGNIEELFGEAVCNHVFMQKTIELFRSVETAIEVALMPSEAYTAEKSAPTAGLRHLMPSDATCRSLTASSCRRFMKKSFGEPMPALMMSVR